MLNLIWGNTMFPVECIAVSSFSIFILYWNICDLHHQTPFMLQIDDHMYWRAVFLWSWVSNILSLASSLFLSSYVFLVFGVFSSLFQLWQIFEFISLVFPSALLLCCLSLWLGDNRRFPRLRRHEGLVCGTIWCEETIHKQLLQVLIITK